MAAPAVVLGLWLAVEHFTDIRILSKGQLIAHRVTETAAGHNIDREPLPLFVVWILLPALVLGMWLQTVSQKRLVQFGRHLTVRVLRKRSFRGVHEVLFEYPDGKNRTRLKGDIRDAWGHEVQVDDLIDVVVLRGFPGGIHVLGRSPEGRSDAGSHNNI